MPLPQNAPKSLVGGSVSRGRGAPVFLGAFARAQQPQQRQLRGQPVTAARRPQQQALVQPRRQLMQGQGQQSAGLRLKLQRMNRAGGQGPAASSGAWRAPLLMSQARQRPQLAGSRNTRAHTPQQLQKVYTSYVLRCTLLAATCTVCQTRFILCPIERV